MRWTHSLVTLILTANPFTRLVWMCEWLRVSSIFRIFFHRIQEIRSVYLLFTFEYSWERFSCLFSISNFLSPVTRLHVCVMSVVISLSFLSMYFLSIVYFIWKLWRFLLKFVLVVFFVQWDMIALMSEASSSASTLLSFQIFSSFLFSFLQWVELLLSGLDVSWKPLKLSIVYLFWFVSVN